VHAERIAAVRAQIADTHARFSTRLATASPSEAVTVPASGGWTPAQIAAHVGLFNTFVAGLLSGRLALAHVAPDGNTEVPFAEVAARLAGGRLEAPDRVTAPVSVSLDEARATFDDGLRQLDEALKDLDEVRAHFTFTHPSVGTLSLYQVGEWAASHAIRHNAQLKRALGR
jgi:hypothetical protein